MCVSACVPTWLLQFWLAFCSSAFAKSTGRSSRNRYKVTCFITTHHYYHFHPCLAHSLRRLQLHYPSLTSSKIHYLKKNTWSHPILFNKDGLGFSPVYPVMLVMVPAHLLSKAGAGPSPVYTQWLSDVGPGPSPSYPAGLVLSLAQSTQ